MSQQGGWLKGLPKFDKFDKDAASQQPFLGENVAPPPPKKKKKPVQSAIKALLQFSMSSLLYNHPFYPTH